MTSNSLSSFSSLMLPVLDFSISIFSILIYSSHSLCFALLGDYFLIYSNSQLTFSVSDLFSDSQKINCYFLICEILITGALVPACVKSVDGDTGGRYHFLSSLAVDFWVTLPCIDFSQRPDQLAATSNFGLISKFTFAQRKIELASLCRAVAQISLA